MGPVSDHKERKETAMEASTSKNRTTYLLMPKDKNPKPQINHQPNIHTKTSLPENEKADVDIINCYPDDDCDFVQSQSDNATVSSSSFGDTFSDVGNCESDNEVMSELRADTGGSGDLLAVRKKRLTSHWRKYIQPLMWRCKWVELQIKKFQSQAVKYDKELEKYNQTKQLKYGNFELKGLCSKSMPYCNDSEREKPMKRKIRKRNEESDAEVFMSQHNLFSFLATNKSSNNGAKMDDDQNQTNPATSADKDKNVGNEFKVPEELLSLDFRDDYSLEQILWKIEVAQTQVGGMKSRINTVISENSGRFSSSEDLMLLESKNALTLTCPAVDESDPPIKRDVTSIVDSIASELMKFNTGVDLVKPEIEDLSHENGILLPKDVNAPMDESPVASTKKSTDGILIYNRRAKKPRTESGDIKVHPIEKLAEVKEEKVNIVDPCSVSEDSSQNEQQLAPKLRSVSKLSSPKVKKKRAARARRKSGSTLWSGRRTPG